MVWAPCVYGLVGCAYHEALVILILGILLCHGRMLYRCVVSSSSSSSSSLCTLCESLFLLPCSCAPHYMAVLFTAGHACVYSNNKRSHHTHPHHPLSQQQVRVPATGARVMVCSDGVWDAFDHTSRIYKLSRTWPVENVPQRMISSIVRAYGGLRDDTSIIVVDVMPPGRDFSENLKKSKLVQAATARRNSQAAKAAAAKAAAAAGGGAPKSSGGGSCLCLYVESVVYCCCLHTHIMIHQCCCCCCCCCLHTHINHLAHTPPTQWL